MPRFDYTRAKNEGYTDAQIQDFLAAQKAKGIDAYVDRKEYEAYQAKSAGPRAPQKPIDPLDYVPAIPGSPWGGLTMARSVDAAPTALGIGGGVVGGVPGAAYGGWIGEGYRQGMRKLADPTRTIDYNAIAMSGIKQGVLQGVGTGLSAGLGLASHAVVPLTRGTVAALGSPVGRGLAKAALPLGGYVATRGLGGALTGMAAEQLGPLAGKAAIGSAPTVERLLGSQWFLTLVRHSPQIGAQLIRQAAQKDAERYAGSPPASSQP